jgi:hypothetical protein
MVRQFDIFPKAVDSDLKVRTELGGLLSVASLSFLVFIIVQEIRTALSPSTSYTMIVNEDPLPATIPVSLSVTIANNCSSLHFECTNLRRTLPLDVDITRSTFTHRGNSCVVEARLRVPAVPGSCHIGLGESFAGDSGEHRHLSFVLSNRNVSHTINRVSFGLLSDVESPVDGHVFTLLKPVPYMITYFFQLIPVKRGWRVGYQSVVSMTKTNLEKMRTEGITGIVFQWNFAAFAVNVGPRTEPITVLISHLLAVFGCFFVFVRVADFMFSPRTS